MSTNPPQSPTIDITIYQRLSGIETDVAKLVGTVESIDEAMKDLTHANGSTGTYQKVLVGGIVVQAILSGIMNQETAKTLLATLFGGH